MLVNTAASAAVVTAAMIVIGVNTTFVATISSQRGALIDLYAATSTNSTWLNSTGWGTPTDPCLAGWYGVVCGTYTLAA